MMKKSNLSLLFLLSACATEQRPVQPLLVNAGQGVEIVRTQITGPSGGLTTSGLLDDCRGPGFGVHVDGTTRGENFLFDSDGNPCEPSSEIFNGRDDAHQRPTDATSVQVNFKDSFGSVSPKFTGAGVDLAPIYMTSSELATESILPEDYAILSETPEIDLKNVDMLDENAEDQLSSKIARWDLARERQRMEAERRQVLDKSAQTLSSLRDLDRLTSRELIAAQHDKMLELMARLRETERQLASEQSRHQRTLTAVDVTRGIAEEQISSWQEKENQLNAERSELQARLGAFESLSQRLAHEKKLKEAAYKDRVMTLETELQQAEESANRVRKELVLEAAQKIAEAERLAYAARLAEQDAKKMEGQRLKVEGAQLMARANELKVGKSIMVPHMSDMFAPLTAQASAQKNTPLMPLENVPITINVKDKTLNDIVADIFQNVRTVAGPWQVDWQLSGKAQYVLEETWTLTAEAHFVDIMAHIQEKVWQQNKIKLNFNRFEKTRLFVITDAQ